MRTNSYISAAALTAAFLGAPHLANAQGLGVNLNVGGSSGLGVDVNVGTGNGLGVDAGVSVGGSNGLNVDAGASVGGSNGGVSVDAGVSSGSSGSSNNLVDIDIGNSRPRTTTGPNGGSLIDLDAFNDALDNPRGASLVDIDIGNRTPAAASPTPARSTALISGDVRISSLSGDGQRADALLGLINTPNLADIDLDATIDDRNVSIIAVADLLGSEGLAELQANLDLDGEGRGELLDALNDSSVLGSILGNQGIDLSDVLVVEVAENGATQVIVLDGAIDLALLGDDGNLADLNVADLANLDIDLLSDEELALIDLDLLPEDLRTEVRLRLLGNDNDLAALNLGDLATLDIDALTDDQLAEINLDLLPDTLRNKVDVRLLGDNGDLADLSVAELANLNVDLLSDEELAQINLDLLPEALQTAVEVRLLGNDGTLADLRVGDLADLDVSLPGTGGTGGGSTGGDDGTPGGSTGNDGGGNTGGGSTGNTGSGSTGNTGGGSTASGDNSGGGNGSASNGGSSRSNGSSFGTLPTTQVGASFGVAALSCDVGVLALANGRDASPSAIASAKSLELVRIEGCERSLIDAEITAIRQAISTNPAVSTVLEQTNINVEQVVGATIQGGTLTLFLDPVIT